jgi:adenine-specific DNA-methyltransferase
VHFVNEDNLVACFEESVSEAVVREIAKRKPERVVFRDSSFSSSPEKINVTEIFKTLSPDTSVKVI